MYQYSFNNEKGKYNQHVIRKIDYDYDIHRLSIILHTHIPSDLQVIS